MSRNTITEPILITYFDAGRKNALVSILRELPSGNKPGAVW
jgi:hypothetical protein